MNTLSLLEILVRRLDGSDLRDLEVIPWAAPVLSFGDPSHAKFATLGLNPSNREYVDVAGMELEGADRRFHTLKSLGLKRWSDVRAVHLEKINDSCNRYFEGNPYNGWFQSLSKLIVGASTSYYGMIADACHLDLVPYATACKWVDLSASQRSALLECTGDALGLLLKESAIETLVLNGQSVVTHFQSIADVDFSQKIVPEWTLPRRTGTGVPGYAYTGKVTQILGVDLGRVISVLGYSHNIQSSFGVTTQVKNSIQKWITHQSAAVCS